jgi:hypothetical protein
LIAHEQGEMARALAESKKNLEERTKSLRKARSSVERFAIDLADQLATVPGMEPLRRSLLEEALRDYQALSPLIVMVAGALLVTDHWQKLQPRQKQQKPR